MNKRSNYVGRRRYFIYFLIFLMCTINYADRSALSVGIPKISAEFHLSSVDQGWLLSSYLWTYVLCLVPSALAVDKWGSKRMATFSVACWSLATMMTGMVWNFGSLIVARLLLGVTELPCFPIGHRAIREWAPASERGLASTVFTSGILAGIAFGALLSGWLISLLGWRICFLIFGAMGFVWLAVWMVVFKDPSQVRWLHQSEREKVLSSRAFDKSPKDERISIRVLLSQKSMWELIIAQVCGNYTNVFFLTWLPSYLSRTRHISILHSGVDTALCYAVACVGTILLGWVSDRVLLRFGSPFGGRRYIVAILLLGSAAMAFAPELNSQSALLFLLTFSLICMQSSLANNQALASDLLRDGQAIGTTIGLLFVFANAIAIAAPVATGFIVQSTGSFMIAFEIAASLTFIGALAVLFMTRQNIVAYFDKVIREEIKPMVRAPRYSE